MEASTARPKNRDFRSFCASREESILVGAVSHGTMRYGAYLRGKLLCANRLCGKPGFGKSVRYGTVGRWQA